MSWVSDDAELQKLEEDTGRISISLDEDAISDFESSDYKGLSGRSRLVRLGQDFEVLEYGTEDNSIYADVRLVNRTDSVNVDLSEGDEVARFFAYNDEDILSGHELTEILENSSIDYELLEDDEVALELKYSYLRPDVSGEISMKEVEEADKSDLIEEHLGWDAGLIERKDHYIKSKPVKMPEEAHGVILGTEHPENVHYNSPLIDAGYGQDSEDGRPIVFEMDYESRHIDGHKPRPVMRFIQAD